jgi:hypothetical protein
MIVKCSCGSLPLSDVSSILRRGTKDETMLTKPNIQMLSTEAATAATVLPCWHSFDAKRRSGYVVALAGRCAR